MLHILGILVTFFVFFRNCGFRSLQVVLFGIFFCLSFLVLYYCLLNGSLNGSPSFLGKLGKRIFGGHPRAPAQGLPPLRTPFYTLI